MEKKIIYLVVVGDYDWEDVVSAHETEAAALNEVRKRLDSGWLGWVDVHQVELIEGESGA